jgi:hypothetical protein
MSLGTCWAGGLLALVVAAGTAQALPIQVVFAIKAVAPGHAKAAVAGYAPAQFTNIGAIYRSHTSNLWIAVPTTDMTPTTQDQVLTIGNGSTFNVVAKEGVTEYAPGLFLDFSTGIPVPRINDSGQWAMQTGNNTVVKYDGANYSVVATTNGVSPVGVGTTWVGSFNSAVIANNGDVSFIALTTDVNVVQQKGIFGSNGTTVLALTNSTVPANQAGGGTAVIDTIDNSTGSAPTFGQSADGNKIIYLAHLAGAPAGQKVAVVHALSGPMQGSTVVAQSGVTLPGFSSPINSINAANMESNGNWYVRVTNVDGQVVLLKNGNVIAKTGAPIFIGSSETWSSIVDVKGNNKGDFVVLGNVTGALAEVNRAAVLNGRKQISRRSDGVDLDGNGLADESLFVNNMQDGRSFLGNDGFFYIGASIKASATGTTGIGANSMLLKIDASYCMADLDDGTGSGRIDNAVDINDLLYFLTAFEAGSQLVDIDDGSGTGTRDEGIDISDLLYFLARFEAGC